jgi:hypothetical protein
LTFYAPNEKIRLALHAPAEIFSLDLTTTNAVEVRQYAILIRKKKTQKKRG